MARLGYFAMIIEGQPAGDDLWKIVVDKAGVRFAVVNGLRMLGNYDARRAPKEHGDKVAYMTIGQAGELRSWAPPRSPARIVSPPTRHCGRGGVGAVMGSKKVKAIVFDEAG